MMVPFQFLPVPRNKDVLMPDITKSYKTLEQETLEQDAKLYVYQISIYSVVTRKS